MPNAPKDSICRVSVHTRVKIKKTLGIKDDPNTTWPITNTLWASVLPFSDPIIVDWQQSQSVATVWKFTFRGIRDFSVADTRFTRKNGTLIYEPISTPYYASRTDGEYTIVKCQRIDKLI